MNALGILARSVPLKSYQGRLLLVGGDSEFFNEVVRKLGLERAGCWSHLRTYFFKALHRARPSARIPSLTPCGDCLA